MAEKLSKHLSKLSKRGSHRVLIGDLDFVGLPGKIYTPAKGNALPAIAFGHDWLKNIRNYHGLLRHLASWGIVAAAPDTDTGINPNHQGFAADLETCLQVVTGVKLGNGNISVAPGRLGIVGHGMGGGAAILAAAGRPDLKAVVAAYPSKVSPSAETAAALVRAPGLVLGSEESAFLDFGNPAAIATRWAGPCCYREITKASSSVLSENLFFNLFTGLGGKAALRERAWGLITGFLLYTLTDDRKYSGFAAADATARKVVSVTGEDLVAKAEAIT